MKKKWFFGWENIKWFITKIGNIYSRKDSFFSKRRIESSIAFIVGQVGMVLDPLREYGKAHDIGHCPLGRCRICDRWLHS